MEALLTWTSHYSIYHKEAMCYIAYMKNIIDYIPVIGLLHALASDGNVLRQLAWNLFCTLVSFILWSFIL